MNKEKVKLSPIKIVALVLIGLALALILFVAVVTLIEIINFKVKIPYLYRSYVPYKQFLVVCGCVAVFFLMFFLNKRIKLKWLSAVINIIAIIALCNPITLFFSFFEIPEIVNCYTIKSEAEFNQCAGDMKIDFVNFPKYNEFDEHNVQFIGKVDNGFFYSQSITAVVKYDSIEECEVDYNSYINSHQFLEKPVIENGGDYLIAAPIFCYNGTLFKVVTEGEKDDFPQKVYMIGINRDKSTLYYLYLDDHDLDLIAFPDAEDLEGEMVEFIENCFYLGK